jgi:hypothetical protein
MKKYLFLAVVALSGCSEFGLPVDDVSRVPVELRGVVTDSGAESRGQGVLPGSHSSLDISVFRADMDGSVGAWSYSGVTTWGDAIDGAFDVSSSGGSISLYPAQYYHLDPDRRSAFIAVYPDNGSYSSSDRTVTYSSLDGATDILCSDIAEGYKRVGGNPELTFKHLLTKIRVDVKVGGTLAKKLWGDKVTSIQVKDGSVDAIVTLPEPGSSDPVTIAADPDVTKQNMDLWQIDGVPAIADQGKNPGIELGENARLFGYAMFLPVPADGKITLLVQTAKSGDAIETEIDVPTGFEAGKGYRIVLTFDIDALKVDPVVGTLLNNWDYSLPEIEDTSFPKPLTTAPDGMTNCYIVAPGESLTFPVSRAFVWEEGAFTKKLRVDDSEYTGGFSAEVVWADADDLINTPTVSGSGNTAKVTVQTKGTTGNAVVAIKRTTASQDIVWSYHIWVSDYNPGNPNATQRATYTNRYNTNNNGNYFVFMDRNLGATFAGPGSGEGTGLFYQWGRKDPFPATGNPDPGNPNNPIILHPGDGSFNVIATSSSTGTVVNTIKNPNVFITASDDPNDWYYGTDRENTLWGHNDVKSVYDPCPAGWRVPVNSGSSADTSPWAGFTKDNGGTLSAGYDWGTNAVYPAAGYRLRDTGAVGAQDTDGRYWSASPYSSGTSASFLCFSSRVFVADALHRAVGMSVRCVRE